MATSIIKSITFVKEWTNQQGQIFYYHRVELENGDHGQIGAKTKMPDKLQVGKSLEYEKSTDEKGNIKIKAISLPNGVYKGGNNKSPEEQAHIQRMIVAQNSVTNAVQYYQQRQGDVNSVKVLAKEFYSLVMELSK